MRLVYTQALVYAIDIVIIANYAGKLQWAVIEWASVCGEREMEIEAFKIKSKQITKEYI